jgi:hypothetical protein
MGKGLIIMEDKKENLTSMGSVYEGRDRAYMDIDRMINEGMSGGSVHARHDTVNIEEARDLVEEEPPYECP